MSRFPYLGLSNVLPEGQKILYTNLMGERSIGRVTDLFTAWLEKEHQLPKYVFSKARILLHSLFEAIPRVQNRMAHIEAAVSGKHLYIAIRAECRFEFQSDEVEKVFTQYWLNGLEPGLFKKILTPHDRIEVRYQEKTRLLEWRVVLPVVEGFLDVEVSESFIVLTDDASEIKSQLEYVEMSELPFQSWLEEVYKTSNRDSGTGSIQIDGNISQTEVEEARVRMDREIDEINREVTRSINLGEIELTPELIRIEQELKQVLSNRPELESTILNLKQSDRSNRVEIAKLSRSMAELEKLCKQKDQAILLKKAEISELSRRLDHERKNSDGISKNNAFREKALRMFEALNQVKQEKQVLERTVFELRNKKPLDIESSSATAVGSGDKNIAQQKHIDELEKKLERITRAFEAEKQKVVSFSERVAAAEKEAAASGSIVQDLENKLEHSIKSAQQLKKEVEAVKQKVVQAEAEKNKIKNELVKAQTQIQTLMKRQAA